VKCLCSVLCVEGGVSSISGTLSSVSGTISNLRIAMIMSRLMAEKHKLIMYDVLFHKVLLHIQQVHLRLLYIPIRGLCPNVSF